MKIGSSSHIYPAFPQASTVGPPAESGAPPNDKQVADNASAGVAGRELTDTEQKEVQALEKKDREVRDHEQAHMMAAGQYARGGATYQFVTGPDGRRYAVSGEVHIDVSEIPNDPEATMRKMQQVRRAALAPLDPSAQDRRVATEASRKEAKARRELMQENLDGPQGGDETAAASQMTQNPDFNEPAPPSTDPLIDMVL